MEKTPEIGLKFKLVPPDGGWGYAVTIAVIILNYSMMLPATSLGLVYGKFLSTVGDETTGITIANGIYNTLLNFTGIFTSFLLPKYGYRKVCLVGTIMYMIGATDLIFVSSRLEFFFSFGVLQGVGCGLIYLGSFTAFNYYFDKKLNTMMGVTQGFLTGGSIFLPPVTIYLMEAFGYKICLYILTGFLLLMFPSVWALHPIKWYFKREPIDTRIEEQRPLKFIEDVLDKQKIIIKEELINDDYHERKLSIISLGHKSMVVDNLMTIEENTRISSKFIDLSLLKSSKFLFMSLGLALSISGDACCMPMIPVLLSDAGFESSDIARLLVILYSFDVVSRVIISTYSAFYSVNNRNLFLGGSILWSISLGAFFLRNDYMWKMIILGSIGFIRTYIQVPYALVIADAYKNDFGTVFSLTLFICGIVTTILTLAMGYIKTTTQSNAMVIYLLSMVFLLSAIIWIIELLFKLIKRK